MLLGPLVLLLRASGTATNLQFLHAKQKEAGGAEHSGDCTQRSYPLVLEAEPGQLCVPAGFLTIAWCVPAVI